MLIPARAQPLVEQLLGRCTFPAPGKPLHCAVSGGADSSALLILAVAAGCSVTSHHVDHGLRKGSAAEALVVAELAERCGADFRAHAAIIEAGPNLEARARAARFALLPAEVATGHTLDDRAETVAINLLRGAARTGLSPLRDTHRHPIVALRRLETERLCKDLDVRLLHDPSNDDRAFVRNRVRHELMPLLNDISRRDVALLLNRQADVFCEEDLFLDMMAAEIDPCDARSVAAAPIAVARRAMRTFITETWQLGYPPGVDSVDRALDVARGLAVSCQIEGGHRIHRTHQRLRLVPPSPSLSRS